MSMTKNSGPDREHCGMPEEMPDKDDETPSKTTLYCCWLKQLSHHCRIDPEISKPQSWVTNPMKGYREVQKGHIQT